MQEFVPLVGLFLLGLREQRPEVPVTPLPAGPGPLPLPLPRPNGRPRAPTARQPPDPGSASCRKASLNEYSMQSWVRTLAAGLAHGSRSHLCLSPGPPLLCTPDPGSSARTEERH